MRPALPLVVPARGAYDAYPICGGRNRFSPQSRVDLGGILLKGRSVMKTPLPLISIGLGKRINHISRKKFIIGILTAATIVVTAALTPTGAIAQMDKVTASMSALKSATAALGPPKIEGKDAVAGKDVPALYFGTNKMNNFFDVVDDVAKERGGTATLFVKAGDEYVRVATNVKKDDGSRAIGTILDPDGPAITMIKKGEAYYGEAAILGKPYITGYDPIKDPSGNVIGIYYVGYLK